jgi:hypothetical protein
MRLRRARTRHRRTRTAQLRDTIAVQGLRLDPGRVRRCGPKVSCFDPGVARQLATRVGRGGESGNFEAGRVSSYPKPDRSPIRARRHAFGIPT